MIITIDGPAGAGKSSVARALARRLGFRFLDTGAMYRAVALAGLRRGLDWDLPEDLAQLAATLDLRLSGERILLDGEDVTESVRTSEVTAVTRYAADNPQVRGHSGETPAEAGRPSYSSRSARGNRRAGKSGRSATSRSARGNRRAGKSGRSATSRGA